MSDGMRLLDLPAAAQKLIFGAVPVDIRLRCIEVSPAWRAALNNERALWQHVDLSDTSGVTAHISGALLRAACARSHGLLVLDLYHERRPGIYKLDQRPKDERCSVRLSDVLAVLADNAQLTRVRFGILWLNYSEDVWEGWKPKFSHYHVNVADLRRLAEAAPERAILEASVDTILADHSFDCEPGDDEYEDEPFVPRHIPATFHELLAVLRRQAPFQRVHLHTISCNYGFWDERDDDRAAEAFNELWAALAGHDSLRHVRLYRSRLDVTLDGFVDACAALPCLQSIKLLSTELGRTSLPQLARLLTECRALTALEISEREDFFVGDDVAALCAALASANTLQTMTLRIGSVSSESQQQFWDASTGAAVLAALRMNPTFKTLQVNNVTHTLTA